MSATVHPDDVCVEHGWKHLPALDGLRGLAVLMVMVHHLFLTKVYVTPGRLEQFVHTGWIGVDLFFVLSGFLITGILIDAKSTKNRYRNFYMRRVLRIFPLYYGVLFLFLIAIPTASTFINTPLLKQLTAEVSDVIPIQWRLWLYLQNFGGQWTIFNHFWSLAVEEHFYLLWPWVVFTFSQRTLLRICWAVIGVAFASRLAWITYDIPIGSAYIFTLCRFDALAIGGMTAIYGRRNGLVSLAKAAKVPMIFAIATFAAVVMVYGGLSNRSIWVLVPGLSLIAAGFAMLVGYSAGTGAGTLWVWFLTRPWLMACGKYSYAAYVFHRILIRPTLIIMPPVKMRSLFGSDIVAATFTMLVAIIATFVLARLSWMFYERSFLRLKSHFEYRPQTTANDNTA